ncbi:hypothetical protein MJD09_08065 [bacterium]|nr:hypothetical protein [bacterium]
MAKDHSADLMQALMAKLYTTITGDDEDIKMPRNKFVSWLLPGIPFVPKDFRFCVKGFNGETAEEIKESYQQAFVLSKFLDFIPDVSREFVDFEMQQTIFTTTQDSISSVYKDVLNYSRVLNNEISDKEKEKLQKFRDLLQVTVEEEDILTGETTTVTKPGRLTLAYTAKMMEYLEAADDYMSLKIDAMSATGDDPEAKRRVHAWAQKSRFLRHKMNAAYMAWVSQGYKQEYEKINAYIDQVTRKSLVLYKQDLIRKFEAGAISAVDAPADFYYTTLFPGNFATSPAWTQFRFYESDYETHYNKKVSSWSAGGGLSLGMFSIGGRGGGSKTEVSQDQESSKFAAELEFTQVQILRPWFDPGFFSMRSWTLDDTWNLTYDKTVSNGSDKPDGRLVAYPVTALFARNVKFSLKEWERHSDYVRKTMNAGGSVGWGPFRVGGSYSSESVKKDMNFHTEGGSIVIPGIQLIGFINNLIPRSPNPNPEIAPEMFVGGE